MIFLLVRPDYQIVLKMKASIIQEFNWNYEFVMEYLNRWSSDTMDRIIKNFQYFPKFSCYAIIGIKK